jgi:hypothetical protein
VFDSNRRWADALGVPTLFLELWVYVGFLPLAIGGMAHISWLGYLAAIVGLGLCVIGFRAAVRPSRPFDAMPRLIASTRAVGIVYVLGGALWIVLSFTVVTGT